MKKTENTAAFSKVKHRHNNIVLSFVCARVKKSIIYVTMHKQKAPINMLSRSKAPKIQQVAVTDMLGKPVDFLDGTVRALTLAPAIILLTCVTLQQFPFLYNL